MIIALVIAAVPAIVVYVVAESSQSKKATLIAASIAILIGVITGNPVYMALDIVAVVIATALALKNVAFKHSNDGFIARWKKSLREYHADPKNKEREKKIERQMLYFTFLCGFGIFAWSIWHIQIINLNNDPRQAAQSGTAPASVEQMPTPVVSTNAPPVHNSPLNIPTPTNGRNSKAVPSVKKQERTIEECLKITEESKMVQCLEKAP